MPRNQYEGLWEHPDWKNYTPGDEIQAFGRRYDNLSDIDGFVAQLQFVEVVKGRRELFTGNGFFLKLPELHDRHLVITASSHLLVGGKRTTHVKVFCNVNDDAGNPSIGQYDVDNSSTSTQVRIFSAYASAGSPFSGYAVISIPRATGEPPRGFGFSLRLCDRQAFGEYIYTSNFDNVVPTPLVPDTYLGSNAAFCGNEDDSLSYVIASQEESSNGGPVWIEYQGYPTAIAIHKTNGVASSGSLFSTEMLWEIFEWLHAGLLRKNIQLQIHPGDLINCDYHTGERGIFLSFLSHTGFARARLDSGSPLHWMLAEVGAQSTYYVLSALDRRTWVQLNAEAAKYEGVQLCMDINSSGIFMQNTAPNGSDYVILEASTYIFPYKSHTRVTLRMEGARLKLYDATRESSEVSVVKVGANEAELQFTRFILADAPDIFQDGSNADDFLDGSDAV